MDNKETYFKVKMFPIPLEMSSLNDYNLKTKIKSNIITLFKI